MPNENNLKGKGFKENPHNINREGRPPSIKKQLKELLECDGLYTIPSEQVKNINEDGSVSVSIPTEMQLAMKLKQLAMSGKNNTTLGALKEIMDRIDGKSNQKIQVEEIPFPKFIIKKPSNCTKCGEPI